jgi:ketosteroid isomerase-like protein
MSEENVEVALETFSRFNPGDLTDWGALWHPDSRATPAEGWVEPGPFVGRDAIIRQFERLFADWSEYRIEQIEVAADSGDWVVVTWRMSTRGAASGIETQIDLAVAYRVRDGMISEGHFRWNRAEALEAAGLSE